MDEIFMYYFIGTVMLLGKHLTVKSEMTIIIYVHYTKNG
jgi:hypothetical protein